MGLEVLQRVTLGEVGVVAGLEQTRLVASNESLNVAAGLVMERAETTGRTTVRQERTIGVGATMSLAKVENELNNVVHLDILQAIDYHIRSCDITQMS